MKKIKHVQSIKAISNNGIYGHIFRPALKRLYINTFKSEKENATFVVQIDLDSGQDKTVKIKLDCSFIEIDPANPDLLYFIEDRTVYKIDFAVKDADFGGFFGNQAKDTDEKQLFGAEVFFQSKQELDFIRFEHRGKFFFVNEGKAVKAIDVETFDVIKVFDQQLYAPTDVFFKPQCDFIYVYAF